MKSTFISWAHHTHNPWWGCRKISAACRFCYAARESKRWGFDAWGSKGTRRMMSDRYWAQPLSWNRKAQKSGEQVRVFCASMADVFEDHPDVVQARQRLWQLIDDTPALTWMLLTKRPENVPALVPWGHTWPPHVWIGVSAETQRFAEERIPLLRQFPAAVRFVSAAPLLGPIDFTRISVPSRQHPDLVWDVLGRRHGVPGRWQAPLDRGVDWVITEGESGPKARPTHPDWFRSIRDQCVGAGVPFHHKQNGELSPHAPTVPEPTQPDGKMRGRRRPTWWVCAETGKAVRTEAEVPDTGSWAPLYRLGVKAAGRELDGVEHLEFPRTVDLALRTRLAQAALIEAEANHA